jgi:Retinal pigment epithelial membrane protein
MNGPLIVIDPAAVSHLSGVFAPVDEVIDVADLPVVGKVSEDLRGVYLRNGPNPKFPPLRTSKRDKSYNKRSLMRSTVTSAAPG